MTEPHEAIPGPAELLGAISDIHGAIWLDRHMHQQRRKYLRRYLCYVELIQSERRRKRFPPIEGLAKAQEGNFDPGYVDIAVGIGGHHGIRAAAGAQWHGLRKRSAAIGRAAEEEAAAGRWFPDHVDVAAGIDRNSRK